MNQYLEKIQNSKIRRFHKQIQNYQNVIDFTLGDSKDDVHEDIQQATIHSLLAKDTHYSSNIGELQLREAICEKEIYYLPEEIYITSGATQGLFEVMFSLFNKQDGILVGIPSYPNYISLIQLFDLQLQIFSFDQDYQMNENEIRSKITEQTKAILINHPHNPTGTVYNQQSISIIHKLILEYNLILIWDATYYNCDYYPSFYHPSIHQQLIQIHSFSKSHQMCGYRIGYSCVPISFINSIIKIHQLSQSCISTFVQNGAMAALNIESKNYNQQKRYVISKLKELNIEVIENIGPYYVYFDISKYGINSETFANRLLKEVGVAVLPGKYFYEENHIRMSICISLEKCKEGCERMKRFIDSL